MDSRTVFGTIDYIQCNPLDESMLAVLVHSSQGVFVRVWNVLSLITVKVRLLQFHPFQAM
jgi:hypothetical protein